METLQPIIKLFERSQIDNLDNKSSKRRVETISVSTPGRVGKVKQLFFFSERAAFSVLPAAISTGSLFLANKFGPPILELMDSRIVEYAYQFLPNILKKQLEAELDFLKWGVKSPTPFPFSFLLFFNLVWIPFLFTLNYAFYVKIIIAGIVIISQNLGLHILVCNEKRDGLKEKRLRIRECEGDKNKLDPKSVIASYKSYAKELKKSTALSAVAFEAEINRFKQCFGLGSIHSVFLDDRFPLFKEGDPLLSTIFWANPLFASYLGRKNITFDWRYDPNCSKVEIDLYETIGSSYIPYRGSYQLNEIPIPFGKRGGHTTEQEAINDYMDQLNGARDNNVLILARAQDMYAIGRFFHEESNQLYLQQPNRRFILLPCWIDGHATAVLGIIRNNKVQYAFLVNSYVSSNYLHCMKAALNLNYSEQDSILLLEASHSLQTTDVDCPIYSKNFIYAICKLLNNDGTFARQLYNANPTQAQKLAKDLVEKMKPYLPMYYKGNKMKSPKEVRNHNLLERWRMGCEVVDKYHNQAKEKLKSLGII